jgi:hypothetical protein
VFHLAALDLSLWVLPFAALIVLAASARHLDEALRAYATAAIALTVWLVLEVGVFASTWSDRIEERNLFYLAPLLFIAFLAWLERGQPRPPRAAVAAAGLAAALPGALPFAQLTTLSAASDTPFLAPWWYLGDRVAGRSNVALLAVLVAIGLGALFLWLPRRWAPLLPALVALGFFLTWLPLQLWTISFERLSVLAFQNGIQVAPGDWIDRAVGPDAHVAAIWSGNNPFRIWENEFWNRSLRRVYDLGPPLPGAMPEMRLHVQPATGVLLDRRGQPLRARYVLADRDVQIDGTAITSDAAHDMTLYRVTPPVRTPSRVSGWYSDTWTTPSVVWTRVGCRPGALHVLVSSDPKLFPGLTQRIAVSGSTPHRVVLLPTTESRALSLPLQPRGGTCAVTFDITPSRKPAMDPRVLGIHIQYFKYVPAP